MYLAILFGLSGIPAFIADVDVKVQEVKLPPAFTMIHVDDVCISADGTHVAVDNEYAMLAIVNLTTAKSILFSIANGTTAVCFSADGRSLYTSNAYEKKSMDHENITAYNVSNGTITRSVRVPAFYNHLTRLGSTHLIGWWAKGPAELIDISDPTKITVEKFGFKDVEAVFLIDNMRPGILFKSGVVMLSDEKKRFNAPRMQLPADDKNALQCIGASETTGKLSMIYGYYNKLTLVSEDESKANIYTHRDLGSAPFAVHRWDSYWMVCYPNKVMLFDESLRSVPIVYRSPSKQSISSLTASALTVLKDKAVLAVGTDEGTLRIYTFRKKDK